MILFTIKSSPTRNLMEVLLRKSWISPINSTTQFTNEFNLVMKIHQCCFYAIKSSPTNTKKMVSK